MELCSDVAMQPTNPLEIASAAILLESASKVPHKMLSRGVMYSGKTVNNAAK